MRGTLPDAPIDVVSNSIDVDLFPTDYRDSMFTTMHAELGYESEFFDTHGFYVEIVRPGLPRFPPDWRERASRQHIGDVVIDDEPREVYAIFPDIHDVTASKVVIGRDQDKAFLTGVVMLGLVDVATLEQRLHAVPRTTPERILEAIAEVRLCAQVLAEAQAVTERLEHRQGERKRRGR